MKRILFFSIFLFTVSVSHTQTDTSYYKHEVRLSYGIETLPNIDVVNFLGGFTANYMYRVTKWFWVGINVNWQFPSEIKHYRWREYCTESTYKDYEISKKDNFFALAPELRFSYANKKWVTLYSALSAGYGIHTGINKKNLLSNFIYDYWYWNITIFGANFHIGKKQLFFVGGEFGVGFKGILSLHVGYRF
jgi:hypothetical protein